MAIMRRWLGVCLLACAGISQLVGQQSGRSVSFERLGHREGLMANMVYHVIADRSGMIWAATDRGLVRYDGIRFTSYKHHPGDTTSLSNNHAKYLLEDASGMIWVATQGGGLNRFDPTTGSFTHFRRDPADPASLSNDEVLFLYEDSRQALWVGTENGLNRYHRESESFTPFLHDPEDSLSLGNIAVLSIVEDRKGRLWVGSWDGGLNLYLPPAKPGEKARFRRFLHDPNQARSLSSNHVWSLHEDREGRLWAGTFGGGLNLVVSPDCDSCLLQPDGPAPAFFAFKNDPDRAKSIGSDVVISLHEDQNGYMWIGTTNGLSRLDLKQLSGKDPDDAAHGLDFATYSHSLTDLASISHNSIRNIFEDQRGIIWLATYHGISKYDPYTRRFPGYLGIPVKGKSARVSAIMEDRRGELWIGTTREGLIRYDRKEKKHQKIERLPGPAGIRLSEPIYSLLEDESGRIWIGCQQGLAIFDPSKNQAGYYPLSHTDQTGRYWGNAAVRDIFQDRQGDFWLGTDHGLVSFDPEKGTYRYSGNQGNGLNPVMVRDIEADAQGTLWIATAGLGLNRVHHSADGSLVFEQFTHDPQDPNSLISGQINSLMADETGIWIATGTGLSHYDLATGAITNYGSETGFQTIGLNGILKDSNGKLWISSQTGISVFDPMNKTVINYNSDDGLENHDFVDNAVFKSREGELFFGGAEGFNAFFPADINKNPHSPPVVITDLRIFNQPVQALSTRDGDPYLPRHISQLESISLSYEHAVISFDFALLNYTHPYKNTYAYRLEGFENNWHYAGTQGHATYTNLDPGVYTLHLKAANNDGVWTERETRLKIVIKPPYWDTWWFKIGLLLVLAAAIYAFVYFRIRSVRNQTRLLSALVKVRTQELERVSEDEKRARQLAEEAQHKAELAREEAEAASRSKSTFLANMSHEIRTPMNGVIGTAELLAETPLNAEQQKYVKTIRSSGEGLLSIINDILDFSKIESGKLEIDPQPFHLQTCVEEIMDLFAAKAADAQIDLLYLIEPNVPLHLVSDSARLRQILINLIHNALKFTAKGEVFLRVSLAEGTLPQASQAGDEVFLQFDIRDTGIGIANDKLEELFQAFAQADVSTTRKYGGTGLGLTISRRLVELMGGQIQVSSQPGEGTTFSFTTLAHIAAQGAPAHRDPQLPLFKGKKALIVEDNPTNQIILAHLLETWGLIPIQAYSGSEAIDALAQDPEIHLILTDMQMPEMDGAQLAGILRGQGLKQPIVLLSSIDTIAPMKQMGVFDAVLVKPVKQNQLRDTLVRIFSGNSFAKTPPSAPLSTPEGPEYPPHSLRILVAEDNLVNQQLTLRMLEKLGYQAGLAENGRIAFEACSQTAYDLVFMDLQMPEMDGLAATRKIRATLPPEKQPIIVAMTANAMQGDREMCLEAGMNDYISKPFRKLELEAMLAKYQQQAQNALAEG